MEKLEAQSDGWLEIPHQPPASDYKFSGANFYVRISVFVKKMPFSANTLKWVREVETFREARNTHENIVRFYGSRDAEPGFKYTIVELCVCSMADVFDSAKKEKWIENQKEFLHLEIPVAFDAGPDQALGEVSSWFEQEVNKKSALRQATEAVAFLHSLHIIHRNLKPSNFLIVKMKNNDYAVKLTDMHFSKNLKKDDSNSKPELEWTAPESMNDDVLSLKTDIFVLGCLFYYVYSKGKHPFDLSENPTRQERENNIDNYEHVERTGWSAILGQGAPCELIEEMIGEDFDARPTAEEVLRRNFFVPDDTYNVGDEAGLCVIFNQTFSGREGERKGTDHDRDRLSATLAGLGFDVVIREDVDGVVLESDMEKIGKEFRAEYSCLVVCILSHGRKDHVFGVDWSPVEINRLKYRLNSHDCPNLHGKPKVFIIQACQGNRVHYLTEGSNSSSEIVSAAEHHPGSQSDEVSPTASTTKTKYLLYPPVMDVLSLMSTVPDSLSFRIKNQGSIFVQKLCTKIDEAAGPSVTVDDIFHQVVDEVQKCYFSVPPKSCDMNSVDPSVRPNNGDRVPVFQIPEMRSSLCKRLRFRKDLPKGKVVEDLNYNYHPI